jgi:hypothetical protein
MSAAAAGVKRPASPSAEQPADKRTRPSYPTTQTFQLLAEDSFGLPKDLANLVHEYLEPTRLIAFNQARRTPVRNSFPNLHEMAGQAIQDLFVHYSRLGCVLTRFGVFVQEQRVFPEDDKLLCLMMLGSDTCSPDGSNSQNLTLFHMCRSCFNEIAPMHLLEQLEAAVRLP